MWSAFIELPNKKDQIKALKEILRVLNKDGFALLEMCEEKNLENKAIVSSTMSNQCLCIVKTRKQ